MAEAKTETKKKKIMDCCKGGSTNASASVGNTVYGMGLIGALVYFMQRADSFKEVIFGIGQAIFWPAFVIYRLLELLKF